MTNFLTASTEISSGEVIQVFHKSSVSKALDFCKIPIGSPYVECTIVASSFDMKLSSTLFLSCVKISTENHLVTSLFLTGRFSGSLGDWVGRNFAANLAIASTGQVSGTKWPPLCSSRIESWNAFAKARDLHSNK